MERERYSIVCINFNVRLLAVMIYYMPTIYDYFVIFLLKADIKLYYCLLPPISISFM